MSYFPYFIFEWELFCILVIFFLNKIILKNLICSFIFAWCDGMSVMKGCAI